MINLLSEDFEDDGRYRNIKNPVATTWLISFDRIQQRDQLAAEYLSFMACIDPKDIPQSLLPPGASRKRKWMQSEHSLRILSSINDQPTSASISIGAVHLATRNWLRKEELLARSTERKAVCDSVFPGR